MTPTTGLGPSYSAYIFAEPQNGTDDGTLYTYALSNGATNWYSYFSATVPSPASGTYSADLNVYAHQPSFINGGGNFVTPVTLSAPILQSAGTYSGCSQNQYTYGTIAIIPTTHISNTTGYFMSIWIPLAGVGGTLSQMTTDLGTSLCGTEIYGNLPADATTNIEDVVVTSGAAIPAGTYRVLWYTPNFNFPAPPAGGSITIPYYFRGNTKS